MYSSVHDALIQLFNLSATTGDGTKEIFFAEKNIIDCRSIRATNDANPINKIVLARNTLKQCYDELENCGQMERDLFLAYYGSAKQYYPLLAIGIKILCKVDNDFALEVIHNYCLGTKCNLQDMTINYELTHDQAKRRVMRCYKQLNAYKGNIWRNVEDILLENNYLRYD